MTLSELIVSYRKENNLSQRKFAKICGLSNGYISMLENGINPKTGMPITPTLQKLGNLASGLNLSINELFAMIDDIDILLSDEELHSSKFPPPAVTENHTTFPVIEEKEKSKTNSLGDSLTLLDGKIRKIPLFESVAAGFGCCANNQIIDYIPLMIDSDAEADETICIKVSGNSMYPKIEDGDIIAVHKQSSIDSGKIGVFLIDNEDGVVKKANYVYDEDWLELLSFNPEYMPRRFEGPDVERVKTLGLVKQIIKMI